MVFSVNIDKRNLPSHNNLIFLLLSVLSIFYFLISSPVKAQSDDSINVTAEKFSKWNSLTTKNFKIYGKKSEKTLLKFAERLESIHYLMLISDGLTGIEKPERVSIYLVNDPMERFINSKRAAAFYRPLASGPIAVTPADLGGFNTIALYHEYAHHFMLQYFAAAYPGWYIEGRAELVSTASFEKKGRISYGKAAQHRQFNLINGTWIPIADLLLKTPGEIIKRYGGDNYYGKSWLLTHYLTFSPERNGQMAKYLRAISLGAANEDAAKAFGDLNELDRDVKRYNRDANFRFRQPELPDNLLDDYEINRLTEAEAEILPYRLEFARAMQKEEAEKFVNKFRAKTAYFPNNLNALQLLGEIELDSRNFAEAHAAADRLISLYPNNSRAHWLKGQIILTEARVEAFGDNPEDGDRVEITDEIKAQGKKARQYFIKANRLDNDDSLALIGYFDSFFGEPAKEAVIGLEGVYLRFPQVPSIAIKLGQALIRENDYSAAKQVLQPLAFSPHGGTAAERAQRLLLNAQKPNNETNANNETNDSADKDIAEDVSDDNLSDDETNSTE